MVLDVAAPPVPLGVVPPPVAVAVPAVAVPPVPLAMSGFAVTGIVPWASLLTDVAVATVVAVLT